MAQSKSLACLAAVALCYPTFGCAGVRNFERNAAAKECSKVGYSPESGLQGQCIDNTVAAWRSQSKRDAQTAIVGGIAIGAAVYGVGEADRGGGDHGSRGAAPLASQSVAGWQRQCTYVTPSGNVTVVLGLGQACPENYAY